MATASPTGYVQASAASRRRTTVPLAVGAVLGFVGFVISFIAVLSF